MCQLLMWGRTEWGGGGVVTHNATPLQLQTHTHGVVTPGFVYEPRVGDQAASTME